MTSTSQFRSGVETFFDQQTGETILPLAAVLFEDDFLGAGGNAFPTAATAGCPWGKKLVQTAGTPVVGLIANGDGGQAKILLDTTAEKQEAVLYFLDNLCIDASKIGGFEVRFQLPVIPGGDVQAVMGMQSTYVSGPDNNTCYIRAGLRGSGALLAESYDGTTTNSIATGTTIATTTEWHIFRADWSNPAAIQFWLDGQNLELGTVSFAPTGTLAVLQPYLSLYKAAAAGDSSGGELAIDYIRAWANRV
jgi:hypothetical protein